MKVNVVNQWGGPSPLMCIHAYAMASIAVVRLIELAQYSKTEAWDSVQSSPRSLRVSK